ncbi:cell division protein ZapE [Carnimonas bestiolae]|uniref:cell division protein ZapE n=1 Tax=Carnimonas bestiolae TaxID=3402172 RepID=UPI003EDC05E7
MVSDSTGSVSKPSSQGETTAAERTGSPMERYRRDLEQEGFQCDAAQEQAVKHLQRLYEDLTSTPREKLKPAAKSSEKPAKSMLGGLFSRAKSEPEEHDPADSPIPTVRGLYFWGGVGRGKTWLVDTFFDSLPFDDKMRTHFNRFMQRVHHELGVFKGESDPLKKVAARFAQEARVICFDEFYVKDITDAMILGRLFESLFAEGVVLVATSNIVPDKLYENGLQRARFLPAIALLKRHCEVVNVDSGVDYRLRALEQVELFLTPDNDANESALEKLFSQVAKGEGERDGEVRINGRALQAKREADGVIWFDFKALCDGPRSQNDYIELANRYHTVLVSHVPQMDGNKDDQMRRFISMVDEFYDRAVKMAMTLANDVASIYSDGNLVFEFERTLSRLKEMETKEFLNLPHKSQQAG